MGNVQKRNQPARNNFETAGIAAINAENELGLMWQAIACEPVDFGRQGLAAFYKGPQLGAVDNLGEPLTNFIRFDVTRPSNGGRSQCLKVDRFGIDRCDAAVG